MLLQLARGAKYFCNKKKVLMKLDCYLTLMAFFLDLCKEEKEEGKKLQFVFNDSSRGNRGLTTISIQGNIFWQCNPTQFL
jgi:hypothetical protein